MNSCPMIERSAEDFGWHMRLNRQSFEVASEALKAQVKILWAQGLLTENSLQVLQQTINDVVVSFIQTETRYYEMKNKLEDYENKGE